MMFRKFCEEFVKCWNGKVDSDSLDMAIKAYNKLHDFDERLSFACGTTRNCVIGSEYVLKFDTCGSGGEFGGNETEYKFYEEVKNSHYSYLFAKMFREEVGNYVIYGQVKVDMKMPKGDSYDVREVLDSDEVDFLEENNICDLHDENWGWDDNAEYWVIIDYACNSYSDNYACRDYESDDDGAHYLRDSDGEMPA